jgi:hypothetical protein
MEVRDGVAGPLVPPACPGVAVATGGDVCANVTGANATSAAAKMMDRMFISFGMYEMVTNSSRDATVVVSIYPMGLPVVPVT